MKKRNLSTLTSQTETLLKDAQDFLSSYTQELHRVFSPNQYNKFYNTTTSLFNYKFMIRKIDYLKTAVHRELIMILDPYSDDSSDSVQLLQDNIDVIKSYRELEMSLADMRQKVVHHSYTSFVDIIKKQGSVLDIIGYMEKLSYDKIYTPSSDVSLDVLSSYSTDLENAFQEKYGSAMYATIQAFRKDYLVQMENPDVCPLDYVFDRRNYFNFMSALKSNLKKKVE